LRERPLNFTNANRKRAAFHQAAFDQQLAEEMALAPASTSIGTEIAGRLQQGFEDASGFDGEHLNISARIWVETNGRPSNGPSSFQCCVDGEIGKRPRAMKRGRFSF
jgi:hypothetical protein